MSGRTRQQYGRSATTSYTSILHDSGGDILNRCSNLFSKFASRVRAASQAGDDRAPPHRSTAASSSAAVNPTAATYSTASSTTDPMLLKYSRYDDTPRYNDYKSASLYGDVKAKTSRYEPSSPHLRSGTSSGATPRYGSGMGSGARSGHALAPSASFSSFSTFKSDYGSSDYDRSDLTPRKRYGSGGVRPTYGRTTSDSLSSDYGLGSAYLSLSAPSPNYDKIGSRYKPSRFLKKSTLGSDRCVEEDEASDELSVLRKNDCAKKTDYWSQYASGSPNVMERCFEADSSRRVGVGSNLSPQLRRRHGDNSLISASGRQRPSRPVTVPEASEGRESTSSIIKRYSGLSTATLDTDTGSTTSSATPDSIADESQRRKERAQLINMYSLPLNVLQNLGSNNSSRKFLKRGGESSGTGEHKLRYDQVKEMAAKVTAFSAFQDDEGSQGPPRKVYGSASAGDVLSAIAKASAKTSDTLSQHSTPDSEKYVLYDPPIVFAKATTRERPGGGPSTTSTATYTAATTNSIRPTKPSSLALTRTYNTELFRSPSEERRYHHPLLETSKSYHTVVDYGGGHYGLHTPPTPPTPTIKVSSSYLEPEHEYTFSTFKPRLALASKHDTDAPRTSSSTTTATTTTTTTSTSNNTSNNTTTSSLDAKAANAKSNTTQQQNTSTATPTNNGVLSDPTIGYVPAVSPASPLEHTLSASVSVKPKTSVASSANPRSKHKDLLDTSYALAKYRAQLDVEDDLHHDLHNNGPHSKTTNSSLSASASTSSLLGSSVVPPPPPPKKSTVLDLLGIHDYGGKTKHHYSFCSTSSVSSGPAPPPSPAASPPSPVPPHSSSSSFTWLSFVPIRRSVVFLTCRHRVVVPSLSSSPSSSPFHFPFILLPFLSPFHFPFIPLPFLFPFYFPIFSFSLPLPSPFSSLFPSLHLSYPSSFTFPFSSPFPFPLCAL